MDAEPGIGRPAAGAARSGRLAVIVAMAGFAALTVVLGVGYSGRLAPWVFCWTFPYVFFWIHGTFFVKKPSLRWLLIGYAAFTVLVHAWCLEDLQRGSFRCGNSLIPALGFSFLPSAGMVLIDVSRSIAGLARTKE